MNNLLLKFKAKDSPYGVTRTTLKAVAKEMDISETTAVHIALSRFAKEVLPSYEADDGPLTREQEAYVKKVAKAQYPKGKMVSVQSLL